MKLPRSKMILALLASCGLLVGVGLAYSQQQERGDTSYQPGDELMN
jgi:hypothetical protein